MTEWLEIFQVWNHFYSACIPGKFLLIFITDDQSCLNICNIPLIKAELLQVGIFFLIQLFAWEILFPKMLEIEETKTTIFKSDIINVGLVFSISNFFINKISHPNKWMRF